MWNGALDWRRLIIRRSNWPPGPPRRSLPHCKAPPGIENLTARTTVRVWQGQESLLVQQQDRLLNLRLDDSIDQATYARKATELRDRLASIQLKLAAVDRSHEETAKLATKVFELSQTLRGRWVTADYDAKRRILEIVCLNCTLEGAKLAPTIRKPFDVLAEGLLVSSSRDDRI